jgi:4-hydroxythreonine-4-phosphate dehydrogenase
MTSEERRPIVAVTMGDPAGVGPEVVAKSFAHPAIFTHVRPVVVGDRRRLQRAAQIAGVALEVRAIERPADAEWRSGILDCIEAGSVPDDLPFGELSAAAGEAAFRYVRRAVELALQGEVAAICTAPLNKEALRAAGHRYPGHTELLAELTHTPEVSMMLMAENLRVIHVTTHIGLLDAVELIDDARVERTILRGHALLERIGIESPRIAVCGINPHAGEGGLFGRGVAAQKIVPAGEHCRARGLRVEGPLPADTLFFRARRGDFDLVVAMYHDQGHGPVKVLGLEAGVNVTVGLPFVRTSVDHGTAFDIAGTGKADEGSLLEALRQAAELSPRL